MATLQAVSSSSVAPPTAAAAPDGVTTTVSGETLYYGVPLSVTRTEVWLYEAAVTYRITIMTVTACMVWVHAFETRNHCGLGSGGRYNKERELFLVGCV